MCISKFDNDEQEELDAKTYNHPLNTNPRAMATIRVIGEDGYSADCPACLRQLPHTDNEHEAALRRVFANSID